MNKPEFVHIHSHSEYSLLDGVGRIPAYIAKLKELGMRSMALTDHGVLYGAHKFWTQMTKAGLKPIIGIEAYLADGSRLDHNRNNYHLILLAQNNIGYKNLLKLSTESFMSGFYYNPRIDLELLNKYSEGIICTSACLGGPLSANLLHENKERATYFAKNLVEIFGRERFYVELQDHGLLDQLEVNKKLIEGARKGNLHLIASNDVHYVNPKDSRVQELLMCISTQKTLSDSKRLKPSSNRMYLRSPAEMSALFSDVLDALSNTMAIAEMCNVDLSFTGYHMPAFEIPNGYTEDSYLEHLCFQGARNLYGDISTAVEERIHYELDVIGSMSFSVYFLVVADFINYARGRGILVGAGRGSAAGSIVSYCLGISSIDPLRYKLIFERFLMPGRIGMPDIDLDFDSERRQEVIDYVVNKYGSDHVAQMATFGTLTARSAIRDTGRVMGIPYPNVERISRLIPPTVGINLRIAMDTVPELQAIYESGGQNRELIDSAFSLEDIARHASTHAAGIVISKEPLIENVPLQKIGKKKEVVTQYSMDEIEAIGLLKMDFLGLKILTVLDKASKMIREHTPDFDINNIPIDDTKTFEMLQRGETAGIHQLEGSMCTFLIKDIKPEKIEDLMLLISLARPGPRELAFEYIERRFGRSPVNYMHPLMEEALKDTLGIMIYQEDVTIIAHKVAGFTLTESEGLRKVISKKKPEEMKKYKDLFIQGCIKNGIEPQLASEIFDTVDRFAGYGLNKAHAAGYGYTGYQCAYTKAHFPLEFMAAWLTSEISNAEQIARIILECRKMGIQVRPPDVNLSDREFKVHGDSIVYSLGAIRDVGEASIGDILSTRGFLDGGFISLWQILTSIDLRVSNRRVIENLAKAGALDRFGDRSQSLATIEHLFESAKLFSKSRKRGQLSLLVEEDLTDQVDVSLKTNYKNYSRQQILSWEKDVLGVYLGEHPLDNLYDFIKDGGYAYINETPDYNDRNNIGIIGVIVEIRKFTTKANRAMATFEFEDMTGRIQVIVFPDQYEKYQDMLSLGAIINLSARMEKRDEKFQLILDKCSLDYPRSESTFHINLPSEFRGNLLSGIEGVLSQYPGNNDVIFHFQGRSYKSASHKVDINDILEHRIYQILKETT